MPPGAAAATPSVLATCRSGAPVSTSVSVAELLLGFGSMASGGGATVAVLTRSPVANGLIEATTVKTAVDPAGMSRVTSMFPVPLVGPVAPPV